MHYLCYHAGRTENCANAPISESVTWLHRGRLRGQRHDCCCVANILFTTGTQESLTLTVVVAGNYVFLL